MRIDEDDVIRPDGLEAGKAYSLVVRRAGKLQQIIPFRVLSPGQEAELAQLKSHRLDDSESALVMDELERLGLPSLAAQHGEELLSKLDNKDVGLLCYLYRLYRDVLKDEGRARSILERAKRQGCDLTAPPGR